MDLPDELALPLASGAEWWYWLGGRPALDFVNTLRERWRRRVETLVTEADLHIWLARAGLVDLALCEPVTTGGCLLAEAWTLREAIDELVTATLAARAPDPAAIAPDAAAIAAVDAWLPEATPADRLVLSTDGRPELRAGTPADPIRHALGRIALDAAVMLGTDERDRLRVCASETCSARFFDRSRGGRRRWCSMEGCGNVAKARRHRARAAETAP